MPVEQQLRDLRRALQRLAAAVMWRDGVPMPQRKHEQVVDASVPMTVHQPGDQARRVPADFCGGGDAVTGPSDSDGFEDCESPDQPEDQVSWDLAEPVHRQSCRHTYGDAATGPSVLQESKTMEIPITQVTKPAEFPQTLFDKVVVDTPVVMQ